MCWFICFWLFWQEMFRECYPHAHWARSSSEIKCSQFIGLFCPSVFLIKCTSSTDIAEYLSHEHPTPIIGPTFSKLASSEDVGKFVCNSNWCENYRQWVRPGINDQLRDRRPRTKVEQQFLHQFNQLGKPFKVFTCFQERLSCYLGDLIFLIKIAFESQGAIY